jgi:oligopeptide transport system ATP-binding protein
MLAMNTLTTVKQPILQVQNLKKYFAVRRGFFQKIVGWVKAVDGVDLEIEAGQTLGLVGESGCGKSTLARLILKLLPLDEGRIVFNQTDISPFTEKEMKPLRKKMQIVFQDPFGSLNPRLSVGQSIEEGLRVSGIATTPERQQRLVQLLTMVGLTPDSADRYPHEFSGGQRQRICIARALSVDPALIICDEPISALDVSIQAQIINLLKDLQDQLGITYLFISHDLNVVGYLCQRVAVMYKGRIMEYAPADELYDNPVHPYTISLLNAIPGSEQGRKLTVKGETRQISLPAEPDDGCIFQGQCRFQAPQCLTGEIALREISPGHSVRCHRTEGA